MMNQEKVMERCGRAKAYHERGFNCAQSVVAAFSDLTGLDEQKSFDLSGGFGRGAGTGELCGAIAGAVMVLGLLTPVDTGDPVGSKQRTVALSKEVQRRFLERFGALRCQELLQKKFVPDDTTPAAKALGVTHHCRIMIVTAVEIVEEMLAEREEQS